MPLTRDDRPVRKRHFERSALCRDGSPRRDVLRLSGHPGTVGRSIVGVRNSWTPTAAAAGTTSHDPRFRDRARDWAGGNGGCLPGVAAATGPSRGRQGRERERRNWGRGSPALATRGPGDRTSSPSQRRPALRSGRTRRLSLPRPRLDNGRKPGGTHHQPFAGTCRGRADGGGRAGRRPGPQGGDVAPRHQALEHLARRPGRRSMGPGHPDARGLRDRPGGRRPAQRPPL